MGITSLFALLSVLETIIKDAPEAVALFNSVKAMIQGNTEPTQAQWDALDAALTQAHAAVQAA